QNNDPVGILHRGHTLGNDNLGGVGNLLQEGLANHGVGTGIHGGGGIVENQNLGLFQQCTGDTKTLTLAAGDVGAALLNVGVVALGEGGNKLVGPAQMAGVLHFLVGGVGVTPAEI